MLEPTKVSVNGRDYTVNPFNPDEAFSFLHALIHAKGTGRSVAPLGKIAIDHCATPDNRRLEDKAVFQDQFSTYPEDMLELESKAMDVLCGPWEKKTAKNESSTMTDE